MTTKGNNKRGFGMRLFGTQALFVLLFATLSLPDVAHAQEVTVLTSFQLPYYYGYSASATPSGLIHGADGYFYGTTQGAGSNGAGMAFKISPQGVLMVLHNFGSTVNNGVYVYEDAPNGLIQGTDGNFYGTTAYGYYGYSSSGGVFRIDPKGNETVLYAFGANGTTDGSAPAGNMVEASDRNFYGVTQSGGTDGEGTVFGVGTTGVERVLYNFTYGQNGSTDGDDPNGGLIQGSDGALYGTTQYGGTANLGTVFKVTLAGTITILHNFGDGSVVEDGTVPMAGLIQSSDGNFYGTTSTGGSSKNGTVFKMTPQGQVTILHSFSDGTLSNDGNTPMAALIQGSDGNFYGTAANGGESFGGVVFEITPQGAYTILHSFQDGTVQPDGAQPQAALVQDSSGNFYGTTSSGGSSFVGSVFEVTPNLPALKSLPTISGTAGLPLTYTAIGTQGTTTYASSDLPAGLSIDGSTGVISGTPSAATFYYTAHLTMTNAVGSNTVLLTFQIGSLPAPVVGGFLSAYGSVGEAFSYTISATNLPTSYSASTPLPDGLSFSSTTGVISGKPTTAGTTTVTISATNGTGTSTNATLTITIFAGAPDPSQEYVILHRFNDGSVTSDAEYPSSIFQGFDGNFYGAAQSGGTASSGSVFEIDSMGNASVLISLGASGASAVRSLNGLVQGCNGNFYGTVQSVGASLGGYVYTANSDGTGAALHHFGDGSVTNDGAAPTPGLIQASDGNFYGTTEFGGSAGLGCIFKVTPAGNLTILHSFGDGTVANDGQYPTAGLVQDGYGNFYGTTFGGGSSTANAGTIYELSKQGVYSVLHKFGDGSVTNDGAEPSSVLCIGDDGNLYGTTPTGGSYEEGCVFQMTPAGMVTILHSFGDGTVTNDGDTPQGPLIEGYDTNFYGTTSLGGSAGEGAVFSISRTGAVTILHSFGDGSVTSDGSYPTSICQGVDGNFYGTTQAGGYGNGFGTVFAILAGQKPTLVPIFTGSTYEAGEVGQPFVFIPKALFGSSISEASGDLVQPTNGSSGGFSKDDGQPTPTYWTETGALPQLLEFSMTSGKFDNIPIVSGTYPVQVTPHNSIGAGSTQNVTFYFDVPPVVSSAATATASVNTPFSYAITVQSGYPFLSTFGMTGNPNWLSVDTNAGIVSGTPPGPGVYTFTVTAQNNYTPINMPSAKTVTLTVTGGSANDPTITSATAVNGTAGTPLVYKIEATNAPTSYTALQLPPGLVCDAYGTISGTPTTDGVFSVPITASNASGTGGSEVTFTIAPSGAPVLPGTLTAQAVLNTFFSYQIPATGLVSIYGSSTLPPGLTLDPISGIISGTVTSAATYNFTVTALNNVDSTNPASATVTLNVAGSETFSSWESSYGISDGPDGNPSGDHIPNLIKYLLDLDPNTTVTATDQKSFPVSGLDTTSYPGQEFLTLTARIYALETGIAINLQTSSDLVNWTTVTPDIEQQIGSDPVTGDPIMEMGVAVTGSQKMFIRLNVVPPP